MSRERERDANTKLKGQTLTSILVKTWRNRFIPFLILRFPVTGAESDKSSILLLRLQKEDGGFIWTHSVLQVILHHEIPYYSIRWWLVYILEEIKKLIVIIGNVSVLQ